MIERTPLSGALVNAAKGRDQPSQANEAAAEPPQHYMLPPPLTAAAAGPLPGRRKADKCDVKAESGDAVEVHYLVSSGGLAGWALRERSAPARCCSDGCGGTCTSEPCLHPFPTPCRAR